MSIESHNNGHRSELSSPPRRDCRKADPGRRTLSRDQDEAPLRVLIDQGERDKAAIRPRPDERVAAIGGKPFGRVARPSDRILQCSKVGSDVYGIEVGEPDAAKALAPLLVPLRFSYLTITCCGEPILEMSAA